MDDMISAFTIMGTTAVAAVAAVSLVKAGPKVAVWGYRTILGLFGR